MASLLLMKPRLLISNDDGITSPFLPIFAEEMSKVAEVEIVVPDTEKSWIGRAYSRHSDVEVSKIDFRGFKTFIVNGTPADCVNIALAHLCEKPDVVVSGLNIGQNIAFPLLWSSGTFAAAVEGAGSGIPSFAFSMRLEKKFYEAIRLNHEMPCEELEKIIRNASEKSADFVIKNYKNLKERELFNVNFPAGYTQDMPFVECVPATAKLCSLYSEIDGKFKFKYAFKKIDTGNLTDYDCLEESKACFSKISI